MGWDDLRGYARREKGLSPHHGKKNSMRSDGRIHQTRYKFFVCYETTGGGNDNYGGLIVAATATEDGSAMKEETRTKRSKLVITRREGEIWRSMRGHP